MLEAWSDGDPDALDAVLPLAFDDLRRIAGRCFRSLPIKGMQATELIGEIYGQLRSQRKVSWQCRGQFYKFAGVLMERVLLGYRRAARAQKRGGDAEPLSLVEVLDQVVIHSAPFLAVGGTPGEDQASIIETSMGLNRTIDVAEKIELLGTLDPLQADIARLRYLVGLTLDETAEVLEVSRNTVKRGWRRARDFLSMELDGYRIEEDGEGEPGQDSHQGSTVS